MVGPVPQWALVYVAMYATVYDSLHVSARLKIDLEDSRYLQRNLSTTPIDKPQSPTFWSN